MSIIQVCPRGHHFIHSGDAPEPAHGALTCPTCGSRIASVRVPDAYEVLEELGRGGMGMVYKVRQSATGNLAAFKIINPFVNGVAEHFERFVNEAAAVTNIDHPNIVRIYEIGQVEGLPFFSLEYVAGGCLSDVMAAGPMDLRRAAEIVEILARAIHHAHQRGIVHRDLKPANILMTLEGEPKIADFGLVKFLHEGQDLTRTGIIMGTPSYMSPEQARGDMKEAGPQADVYALGVILFQAVTGRIPLHGENEFETLQLVVYEDPPLASESNPEAPGSLDAICLRCMQKEPARRYASAEELADDLRRYLEGKPVEANLEALKPARPVHPPIMPPPSSRTAPPGELDNITREVMTNEASAKLRRAEQVEFLRGLSPSQMDTLSRCGSYREFAPGEIIFREGDSAQGLFIVLQGQVQIYNQSNEQREVQIALIQSDQVFGEMGLVIDSGTRTASARAAEKTVVFELPGNPVKLIKLFSDPTTTMTLLQNLLALLRQRLQLWDRRRMDLLREYVPGVSDQTLAQKAALKIVQESLPKGLFKRYTTHHRLEPGELLFRQGDEPDGFYFVQTGELDILKDDGKGGMVSVGRLRAPNIVGEMGFFSGERRLASVRAIDHAVVTRFSGQEFHRLKKRDPETALNVMLAALQLAVHLIVQRNIM